MRGFLVSILLVAFATIAWGQPRTLKLATEGANPPFNQRDGDTLTGFDVDIGNAICAKLNYTCTWVSDDWDRFLPDLNAKAFDVVISSFPINDDGWRLVDFGRPYYRLPFAFIARKDTDITSTTIEGLKGRTVGVEAGTLYASYLTDALEQEGVTVKAYGSLEEADLDLAEERIDAVFGPKLALDGWLASDDGKCCRFVGADIYDEATFGPGPGMAFRKEDAELREAFDRALGELLADGTFDRIAAKYVRFSIRPDMLAQKIK